MDLAIYLKKPLQERLIIIKSPVISSDSFWLERLKTAIQNSNPFAVMFNKDLVSEYWTLKSKP